jgi:hypothetical protein
MKICGVTSIVVFEAATTTPAPSNVNDGIDVVLPTVLLVTLLATAIILAGQLSLRPLYVLSINLVFIMQIWRLVLL